ncbi:DUF3800 domain-containing protein [Moraxellaceae bacterium AER2_44_116]|nr:DUF3800 domain-containing protein [Moraxellaceae bacterium AER2_44_116]
MYFDESGYTGNNLLHPDQKLFSYASVVTDDDEAKTLVEHIINKYNIQNGEIKGKNLLKGVRGRRAIDEIIQALRGRIKVSISNKKYALAGKFFEYIFEPPLQKINSLFYGLNFHKFVSNILYVELVAKSAMAEDIFKDFESFMRSGDVRGLTALFSSNKQLGMSPIMEQISEFAILHKTAIMEEIDGYVGVNAGKWVLDLTNTTLFSLLAQWGQEYEVLTAYCDYSKPLSEDQEIFNTMIGNTKKIFTNLAGLEMPITFNLAEPINLVDSKIVHGVQLADAVAAAFVYACDEQNTDEYALKWRSMIDEVIIYGSVFPDMEHLDLKKLAVQRNVLILIELVERSKNGISLTHEIDKYITYISQLLLERPLNLKC